MKPSLAPLFHGLQQSLLLSASPFVPASERAEWRREWQAELWHVRQVCISPGAESVQAQQQVFSFCLGAFQDALCLRRNAVLRTTTRQSSKGSAARCLLWLVAILFVCYAVALLLPGVRLESHPSWYQVRPGTILIPVARYNESSHATMPVELYRFWKRQRQRYFDGFAFYRMGREVVSAGTGIKAGFEVAHASSNLFSQLGLSMQLAAPAAAGDPNQPRVILSDEIWQKDFGGDPGILGNELQVGARLATIAGVEAEGAWRLPGKPDLWLLEPDAQIGPGNLGYVVAHLTPLGQSDMWTHRVHIAAYGPDNAELDLWGVSFEDRTRGPWDIYKFTLLLAFLALPAITSVSLAEYSVSAHRPSWPKRLRRWAYLAAKIALLLPIVYYASLDLAYWFTTSYSSTAQYMQLVSSFAICLFGLRWVILDQRRRCPVCLRRVAHPAQVGVASRTFLAWNGTELMCTDGHTLLHVPSLPTSWFGTQRWLYLDSSWQFLFAGSGAG